MALNPADTAISTVAARAALAGNPSDAYAGCVLAVPVLALGASVRVTREGPTEIRDGAGRPSVPGSGVHRLIDAAIRRFAISQSVEIGDVSVDWSTSIPRSVGLAGSSAIVLATLEAVGELVGAPLDPLARAAMALAVETDDLGIAAGPQDRVVQALATPVLMRFDDPGPTGRGTQHRVGGAALAELYVAWSPAGAAPSAVLHGDLRRRWADGDDRLRAAMVGLAATAEAAAIACESGDRVSFDEAVNASLRLRTERVGVDVTTTRLAGAAQRGGASANTAGSGGAIAGRCDPDRFDALVASIEAEGGVVIGVDGRGRS